jgi:hypothetical protein
MRPFSFRLGLTAAALALAASPALAQRPREGGSPAAERPVAVERPAAAPSAAAPATSAPAASSSIMASPSPSAGPVATPRMGFGSPRAFRETAPQHRAPQSSSSSSGHGGQQAVPRGSSGSSSASGGSAPAAGSRAGTRSAGPARQGASQGGERAVPSWARPRGDRPSSDTAVTRTTPRPDARGFGYGRYWDPWGVYIPGYYGSYGYRSYGYYSPYYYPYSFGYGYGVGMPWMWDPWYGDDFYYGGGGYYGGGAYSTMQQYSDEDQGKLRLKVKPRDAKVYVDGYLVGVVDEMDGVFQKLSLTGGRHHVVVKADGYQPEEFDVMITPSETVTYQGDLKKIQ